MIRKHTYNITMGYISKLENMQNYCKCIISHAKSYTYIISWSLFTTWTRTYVKRKHADECTKHEKFNT